MGANIIITPLSRCDTPSLNSLSRWRLLCWRVYLGMQSQRPGARQCPHKCGRCSPLQMFHVKHWKKLSAKEKSPASAKDFLCFSFRLYFVLSRTIRVRNVAPLWDPSIRRVRNTALSPTPAILLRDFFCLAMKASLGSKYKKSFT